MEDGKKVDSTLHGTDESWPHLEADNQVQVKLQNHAGKGDVCLKET